MTLLNRPTMNVDVPMSSDELRDIAAELGLNQSELSRLLGVDLRTVQRWHTEQLQVSPLATRFMRLLVEAKISGVQAAELIHRRLEAMAALAQVNAAREAKRAARAAAREAADRDQRRQEAAAVRKTRREANKRSKHHATSARHRPRLAASLATR